MLADAFVAEIFRAQRVRMGRCNGLGAAVSAVVTSRAPRSDRRVHALVLDGVITRGQGEPRLWPIAEPPHEIELRAIARRVQARLLAHPGPGEIRLVGPGRGLRGRVPVVEQALVEGPLLSGFADGADGLGARSGAEPRLRVRLARPLSGGTTHAVLSTRMLAQRLREVVGEAVALAVAAGPAGSTGTPVRAHGLLWPVPVTPAPQGPIAPAGFVRAPNRAQGVRPLRDVSP